MGTHAARHRHVAGHALHALLLLVLCGTAAGRVPTSLLYHPPIRILGVLSNSPAIAPYRIEWNSPVPCEVIDESCRGGYPAVNAWMAHMSQGVRGHLRTITPDHKSRTILAHPDGLGLNHMVWQRLGIHFATMRDEFLLVGGRSESLLQRFFARSPVPMLLSVFQIDEHFAYLVDLLSRTFTKVVAGVKVGIIVVWSDTFQGRLSRSIPYFKMVPVLSERLRKDGVQQIVLLQLGLSTAHDAGMVYSLPELDVDVVLCEFSLPMDRQRKPFRRNGTAVFFLDKQKYQLTSIDLIQSCRDPTEWTYSVNFTDLWGPLPPAPPGGSLYPGDVEWIQYQLGRTTETEYPVAMSTAPMPASETNAWNRPCRERECESGSLTSDAMRESLGADVAIANGGLVRSHGWDAGPIQRSSLWTTYPFANRVCRVNVTGSVLLDVFNHGVSMILANGSDSALNDVGLFPQVSGARYTFSPPLPNPHRVTVLKVFNATSDAFDPVVRRRIYVLGVSSFLIGGGDGYSMLRHNIQAGSGVCQVETVLESVVAYLKRRRTHTPTLDGRIQKAMQDGGAAPQPLLMLNQTRYDCTNTEKFNAFWQCCEPCPAGLWHPDIDSDHCVERAAPLSIALIAGVVVASLVLVGIPTAWKMTEKSRRINALYNNNKVAEECAVAVVDLRLSDLDYLNELPNPNTIQSAFISIVRQMKFYMEFMPKNLIANYKSCGDSIDGSGASCDASERSTSSRVGSSRSVGSTGMSTRFPSAGTPSSAPYYAGRKTLRGNYAKKKRISVLAVNSVSHVGLCGTLDVEGVVRFHSMYIELFVAAVERNKGIAEVACGDRVFAVWNTVIDRSSHAGFASNAALQLVDMQAHGYDTRAGLCCGSALVGLFGGSGTKKYDIISKVVPAASILMFLNEGYDTKVLLPRAMRSSVSTVHHLRIVDYVSYRQIAPGGVFIYELSRGCSPLCPEEWMYQFGGQHPDCDPFAVPNQAWHVFIETGQIPTDCLDLPEKLVELKEVGVVGPYTAPHASLDLL